jgi:hypothetical protein
MYIVVADGEECRRMLCDGGASLLSVPAECFLTC